MLNNKNCNIIPNSILLLCFAQIKDVLAFTCYKCQGTDCQMESKINDTTNCIPLDECVSVFNGFSTIARGCYSNLPEMHKKECDDPYNSNCHMCSQDLCNNLGPTKCTQCTEKENWLCLYLSELIVATRCPISTEGKMYCYATSHNDTEHGLERGYLRDVKAKVECQRNPKCTMCQPIPGFPCNNKLATAAVKNKPFQASSQKNLYDGTLIVLSCSVGIIFKRGFE